MNYRIAIFDLSTDLVDKLNQIYLKLSVMSTVNTFILTDFVYSLEITMAQFSHKVFNSFIFNVHNMLYKRCFFPHINIILQFHFFSSILPQLPPSHATQLGYTAVITGLPFSFFSVTLSFFTGPMSSWFTNSFCWSTSSSNFPRNISSIYPF